MKKLLALVLALVMTLSLCTVSNAAYSDAADVDYKEAVDVMSAVGVFQGADGKFSPKAELTREQAAKLIAYLDLGEKVAEALPAVKVFNDVEANRWSAKYVAYCADAGYLAGVGNGNFDPAGKLTGYAFGKMLLCVLGYDAAIEEFTGANWQIAVAKLMQSNDIAKSVDASSSATLTREAAAQYCLNTLKATMVEYTSKGTNITINGAVIATGASKATAVEVADGTAYATKISATADDVKETVELGEKLYDGKFALDTNEEYDAFRRPAHTWTYADLDDNIGTYVNDTADYVLVNKDSGNNLYNLLKDNGLEKKLTKLEDVDIDDGDEVTIDAGLVYELWVDGKNITKCITYNYVLDQVTDVVEYTDEDDAVKYGFTKEYTFETLDEYTYYDKLAKSKTDCKAIGEFEEDDVVVYAVNEEGEAVYSTLAKADSFNGKMTAFEDEGCEITVDGKDYVYAADGIVEDAPDYDTTFTYFTDPNGIIIGKDEYKAAESNLKYAYILDSEVEIDPAKLSAAEKASVLVKVVFTDGEVGVYNLTVNTATEKYAAKHEMEKGDHDVIIDGNPVVVDELDELDINGSWMTYTLSDKTITLKAIADDSKFGGVPEVEVSVKKNEKALAEGLWANTSTKFVYMDDEGKIVATYTGYAKFPTDAVESDNALVIYGSSTKYAKEVYIVSAEAEAEAEKIDVAMFVSTGKTTEDGVVATFYVAGEKKTYTVDAEELGDAVAGKLYEIAITDDTVELAALTAGDEVVCGNLDVVGDDYVVVGEEYSLADDVAVYTVARDEKTMSASKLSALEEDLNVVLVLNSNKVVEIYIYRDTDFDGYVGDGE